MEFGNLNDLEKYLNSKIAQSLETDVKKAAVHAMQSEVIETVYDKYTPQGKEPYKRTGGLYQEKNIKGTMVDGNTLEIENIRRDEDTGYLVAPIVEEGVGYNWYGSEIYKMQPFPRPFVENTYENLKGGLAKQALADGLRKAGLTVE